MLVRLIVSGIKPTVNAFFWTLTIVRQAPLTATLVPFFSLDKNLPVVEIVKVLFVLVMTLPRLVIIPVNILPFIPTVRSLPEFRRLVPALPDRGVLPPILTSRFDSNRGESQNPRKNTDSIPQKNSRKASFLEKLSFDNLYFYIRQFIIGQVVQNRS